jgi:hypothetical protein
MDTTVTSLLAFVDELGPMIEMAKVRPCVPCVFVCAPYHTPTCPLLLVLQEQRMRAYDALHVRNRLAQTIASLGASRKTKSTAKIVTVGVCFAVGGVCTCHEEVTVAWGQVALEWAPSVLPVSAACLGGRGGGLWPPVPLLTHGPRGCVVVCLGGSPRLAKST